MPTITAQLIFFILFTAQLPLARADVAQEINTLIANKQQPYLIPSQFENRATDLDTLYKANNYQLLWLGNSNSQQKITDALNLLASAPFYGLNSADYNVITLREKLPAALSLAPDAFADLALYDTALSLSLLRFGQHLHYGRVNFTALNFPLTLRDKKILDLPMLIKTSISENKLAELPAELEPKLQQYQQLKTALATYRGENSSNTKTKKAKHHSDSSTAVSKIQLAMERLRWLPDMNAQQSIIVNIPAFQLWAIDTIAQDPKESVMTMRVVTGKADKHQTPIVMANMKYIELMPYWNVPNSILKKEILPKLAANPGYLARQNMEVVHTKGGMRVRQKPGGRNALGVIKFAFPNKNDVYLHDTPSKSLFAKSRRDFSHGCVRVEKPAKLAEFVLKHQEGWNNESIAKALNAKVHRYVTLKTQIPVLFFYSTAFYETNNKLTFYNDVYGQDATLLNALANLKDVGDSALFAPEKLPEPVVDPETIETETSEPFKVSETVQPPTLSLPVLEPLSP